MCVVCAKFIALSDISSTLSSFHKLLTLPTKLIFFYIYLNFNVCTLQSRILSYISAKSIYETKQKKQKYRFMNLKSTKYSSVMIAFLNSSNESIHFPVTTCLTQTLNSFNYYYYFESANDSLEMEIQIWINFLLRLRLRC